MELILIWSDGSREMIAEGYKVLTTGALSETSRTVKIGYENLTTQMNVTVNKPAVVSISVKNMPNLDNYEVGDIFSTAGLVLDVTYADGITEPLYSGYTVTSAPFVLGENTVTVEYGGQSLTLTVTVGNGEEKPGETDKTDDKGCSCKSSAVVAMPVLAILTVGTGVWLLLKKRRESNKKVA